MHLEQKEGERWRRKQKRGDTMRDGKEYGIKSEGEAPNTEPDFRDTSKDLCENSNASI